MSTKSATDATGNIKVVRLSGELFDLIASHTTLGDNTIAMARGVLVDGRKLTEVAVDFKTVKQHVSKNVEVVRHEFNRLAAAKPPLINENVSASCEITVTAPYPLAVELATFCNAMKELSSEKPSRARRNTIRLVLQALKEANGELQG